MIRVRNCDTPVIKREIALPFSPKSLGKAECARDRAMPQPLRSRRSYDHRIREIVCRTGNPRIFHHLRIPRSTTASWLSRGRRSVVSLDWNHDMASVLDDNERLKRRVERQTAIIRLLVVLLKLSGFRLDEQRLPDGAAKAKILRGIDRCKGALSLKSTLRLVRLSPARYHAWKRAEERCELDDRSSCPRSHPTQLTPTEVSTIKEMVTATGYRHMPLRTLSLYAQRAGHVFASATTWAKLVRQRGWRRPRRRVYPEKPKTGIRATHANEYWHIDVTVIRLLDDTKCYLHAVIDNFSRRILSWRLAKQLAPTTTCEILQEAGNNLDQTPTVVADSGVENVNARVDQLMADGVVRRVLAQVEVSFSNSMIEAFWRSLRHQWLYLHSLDSFRQLGQLIDFYVNEHNTQMPHHAFRGQTPHEIYFGRSDGVRDHLTAARHRARSARIEANRGESCRACPPPAQPFVSDINAVANAPP
jgi:transposase InsO family protein